MLRSFHLRTVAVILFFLPGACLPAQTISNNFIIRDIPKERISDTCILRTLTPQKLSRSVQHFDGLGRPVQECLVQASPQMNHLVRFVEYDLNGRQPKDYLMFAVSPAKGTALTDPGEEQRRFFSDPPPGVTPVDQPYAEVVFDTSPLNEVIRRGAPGKTWDVHTGHPSLQRYSSNPQPVPRLVIDPTGLVVTAGVYPVNSLYLSETTDENGHVSRVYSDKKDRTILTETLTEGQPVQTFYVYDDRDLLRAVIQPEAVARGMAGNPLFSFLYRYDRKKRLIEKHIPGMEAVFIVYDKLDRPILTQDGNLRKRRQWLFNRYDAFGRIIMTGILTDSLHTSRESLQEIADRHDYPAWEEWLDTEKKYTDRTFPTGTITPLSFNYYDQYEFIDDTLLRFVPTHDFPEPASGKIRQRATGTRVRLTTDDNARWLTTVHYYDVRGRTIQTVARNHTGGWDRLFFAYDFRGRLLRSRHVHSHDGKQTLSLLEHYAYDHADRLTDTWRQVNNQPPVLASRNIYNELGQLMEKKLHSQDGEQFLQSVTYTYNGRGWLTAINNPDDGPQRHRLFAMEISYDNPPHGLEAHGLYNGNISSICWVTDDQERRAYAFIYDELNRLTAAHYRKYNGTWNTDEEDYSVPLIRYDLNGNIDTLARHGRLVSNRYGLIDAMKYYYYGNRLIALDDFAAQPPHSPHFSDRGSRFSAIDSLPEYTYDDNGNMTSDANKGMVLITYDHLNLPSDIWLEGDRRISFTRDALGRKMTRLITGGEFYVPHKTDYIGNFVYVNDSLAYILTDGGRLIPGDDGFVHEYFLTDHLGNIRLCFRDSAGLATVTQVTHYYPFGMEIHGLSRQRDEMNNPYLFNGKELHDEHGVMWYDYGARFYDPQLGRWHSSDPLAEGWRRMSPYNYAANNPIIFIDPDGMIVTKFEDEDKNLLFETKDGSNATVIVAKDKVIDFKKEVDQMGDKVLYNPQTEAQTTIDLAEKYMKEGQALTYYRDEQGNIKGLSVGEAAKYHIYQIGARMTGGIGPAFTIAGGFTWDSHGNVGVYGSIGGGVGYDASIGIEFVGNESYSCDFNIKDLRGASADYTGGASVFDFSTGGNANSTTNLFTKTGSQYTTNALGISASPNQVAATRVVENMGVCKLFNVNNLFK